MKEPSIQCILHLRLMLHEWVIIHNMIVAANRMMINTDIKQSGSKWIGRHNICSKGPN